MTTCNIRNQEGLSPTIEIYYRLKPYWKSKLINDQDWAVVLVCLRRIERKCAECKFNEGKVLVNRAQV